MHDTRYPFDPFRPVLLLVERSDHLLKILRDWVGYAFPNCQVHSAASVAEACAIAAFEQPAAMFVDVDAPDGDGFRSLRTLRARFPRARLVAVSMFNARAHHDAALGAGATDCVAIGADGLRDLPCNRPAHASHGAP